MDRWYNFSVYAANRSNEYAVVWGGYDDDYCQLIDNKVKGAEDLVVKFAEDDNFRIAVSVDMLDTGVDVPEIV